MARPPPPGAGAVVAVHVRSRTTSGASWPRHDPIRHADHLAQRHERHCIAVLVCDALRRVHVDEEAAVPEMSDARTDARWTSRTAARPRWLDPAQSPWSRRCLVSRRRKRRFPTTDKIAGKPKPKQPGTPPTAKGVAPSSRSRGEQG